MNGIYLEIPEKSLASAGIPRPELEMDLLRSFVAAMYAEEVIGGSAPCMLAGLEKSELHHWLGGRIVIRPLCGADYELERRNLEECLGER